MKRIHVEVSSPYDVLIGRGVMKRIPEQAAPLLHSTQVAVVTDDTVAQLYLETVTASFEKAGYTVCSFAFPHGEPSKNIHTLSELLEFLALHHIRRNDTILALGGGVVGDIAGLAAAIYMRGVNVIQIPTTLLAAVDSSVGGKTAIDLKNGKNLAGAFWQPCMVICDVDVIERLPEDVFAEGMAEAIKCSVIRELPIIGWIEAGTLQQHLDELIYECVALKRDVVEQDEFDQKGIRNILNVGHTVAHAIEKLSGYTVSHGHAVGTGMVIEAELAAKLGMCDAETVGVLKAAAEPYGLLVDMPWPAAEIADAMKSDKKNRDARIVFELPRSLGKCEELKLERDRVVSLLS